MSATTDLRSGIEKLISKFPTSTDIILPYSDEWIAKNHKVKGFAKKDIKEYNSSYGEDYKNHLAIVYLPIYGSDELRKEITKLFSFPDNLVAGPHNKFMFVNFITNQVVIAGIDRSDEIFLKDCINEKYLTNEYAKIKFYEKSQILNLIDRL